MKEKLRSILSWMTKRKHRNLVQKPAVQAPQAVEIVPLIAPEAKKETACADDYVSRALSRLNPDQQTAIRALCSRENVFLTGPGGTGKTFVINEYLSRWAPRGIPVLATTGSAAMLLGGRTFHSFFNLGIMEGGFEATIVRSLNSRDLRRRILETETLIIDEVSMLHPLAFEAAHIIAKSLKRNKQPFGGIRMILTGDFFQLPPVDRFSERPNYIYQSPLWKELNPKVVSLQKSMRTEHESFVQILNKIRWGIVDDEVITFLRQHSAPPPPDFHGTFLYGKRADVDAFNSSHLEQLKKPLKSFLTEVIQHNKDDSLSPERIIAQSPLPEVLELKVGALVMIRKNDIERRYANGSLGFVTSISLGSVGIRLHSGAEVSVTKEDFQSLDADGRLVATVRNFPLTLGWATTIHKSQGASIDRLFTNLGGLWEYGQAYVALSRARDPQHLYIQNWKRSSIKADPRTVEFYSEVSSSNR